MAAHSIRKTQRKCFVGCLLFSSLDMSQRSITHMHFSRTYNYNCSAVQTITLCQQLIHCKIALTSSSFVCVCVLCSDTFHSIHHRATLFICTVCVSVCDLFHFSPVLFFAPFVRFRLFLNSINKIE